MGTRTVQLDIFRTAIPMRNFEHAAATRKLAEAVVVRVELSDGREGWGETLPRSYVTGETMETVVADLQGRIWEMVRGLEFAGDGAQQDSRGTKDEAMAAIRRIPRRAPDGRCMHAAACAVELALIDALSRPGGPGGVARLLGLPRRQRIDARASGVLGSRQPRRTARRLRLMRLFGLRDFKLKLGLGDEADEANLRVVQRRIGRAVAAGRCSLRVDVNGGWDADSTPARVAALKARGVCAVEQPVFCAAAELADLAGRCELPLLADESLVTRADAEALLAGRANVWWNIRISKNGGLLAALELADLAAARDVPFTVGCMVGESGILSAAQRRLLEVCPLPRFVEGNYGRLLLAADLTRRSPRMGWGGRLGCLVGGGLGVAVDRRKLAAFGRCVASHRAG